MLVRLHRDKVRKDNAYGEREFRITARIAVTGAVKNRSKR